MWFFTEMSEKLNPLKKTNESWELEEVIVFETDKNVASVRLE